MFQHDAMGNAGDGLTFIEADFGQQCTGGEKQYPFPFSSDQSGQIYAAKWLQHSRSRNLRHEYPVYLDRRSVFHSLHEDPRAEFRSQTEDL